jgi:predicted short-subunit dehydrogenase-like oxidoreductase (DUF2520 family)
MATFQNDESFMIHDICIIGSGNVAWHLSLYFAEAGCEVLVIGRDYRKADEFEDRHELIRYVHEMSEINSGADLFVLCVNDDAIEDVLKRFDFKIGNDQILIHTSGSVPSTVLQPYALNYGVLWPVMTLTQGREPEFQMDIPYVITGSNDLTLYGLTILTDQISNHFTVLDDKQRKNLHLAAIMVNNFTNHLYTLSYDYCEENQLDFDLLKPIIEETAFKISGNLPSMMQTGPAKRNDKKTIENHLTMLESHEELYKFYCMFTESIIKRYSSS